MQHLSFEVHRYAPELTKAMFNGIELDVKLAYEAQNPPSRKSLVRAVRESKQFRAVDGTKRFEKVKKEYSDEKYQWLNSTLQGSFTETSTVIELIDKLYEPESVLLDGSTLPEPKILVRFSKNGAWQDVTHIGIKRYQKSLSVKSKIKPLYS